MHLRPKLVTLDALKTKLRALVVAERVCAIYLFDDLSRKRVALGFLSYKRPRKDVAMDAC